MAFRQSGVSIFIRFATVGLQIVVVRSHFHRPLALIQAFRWAGSDWSILSVARDSRYSLASAVIVHWTPVVIPSLSISSRISFRLTRKNSLRWLTLLICFSTKCLWSFRSSSGAVVAQNHGMNVEAEWHAGIPEFADSVEWVVSAG